MATLEKKIPMLRGQKFIWIIVGSVILLAAVFEYAGLLQWLRQVGEFVLRPLKQSAIIGVKQVLYPVEISRIAFKKYTYILDLELRYAESAAQLGELENLRQENTELRRLLEDGQATASTRVNHRRLVSILSYSQPVIAAGQEDGIQEGDLVFVSGVCVGRVKIVSEHQASVRLLNEADPVGVLLAKTQSGATGIIKGTGTQILLTEVPIDVSVGIGERVETMGQVGVAGSMYLGRVQEIRRAEGSPTQSLVIDQGVSFFRSSVVEVGR
jgi:cell shape-determining protein MreC